MKHFHLDQVSLKHTSNNDLELNQVTRKARAQAALHLSKKEKER